MFAPSRRPHTRSHSGIVRPKVRTDGTVTYLAACLAHAVDDPTAEPRSYQAAMSIPHWGAAMEQEYHALMKNKTWTLVPPPSRVNIIDSKWVFKVKKHADGSIERYKARLVAKGFKQRQAWTMRIHSAQLSSPPLFDFFCLWQFLADGLSASLMCKTLFFMDCLKKRFICGSHLDLLITLNLIISVI